MRREAKTRETRERLVKAALACFGEEGYEGATVEQITQRAGVAKGTFFNYFRSKADVLLQVGAVQEEWMLGEIERMQQRLEGPVHQAIIELMVTTATRLPLTRPLVRAMYQATLHSPEESDAQVQHFARVGYALVPLCELGRARGELRQDVSAAEMAGLIMQSYTGVLLTWSLTSGTDGLEPMVRRTFTSLFEGLKQPPPS